MFSVTDQCMFVCACTCRVDDVVKQTAEIRDLDRRLRALESEVNGLLEIDSI